MQTSKDRECGPSGQQTHTSFSNDPSLNTAKSQQLLFCKLFEKNEIKRWPIFKTIKIIFQEVMSPDQKDFSYL